jgi:hypothetical protein
VHAHRGHHTSVGHLVNVAWPKRPAASDGQRTSLFHRRSAWIDGNHAFGQRACCDREGARRWTMVMEISALPGQPRQQPHFMLFGSSQQPVPPSVAAVINEGPPSFEVGRQTQGEPSRAAGTSDAGRRDGEVRQGMHREFLRGIGEPTAQNHHPERAGHQVRAVRGTVSSPRGTQRTRHPTQIHRGPPDQNESTVHSQ